MQTHWMKPPDNLNLTSNQVDIWRVSLDRMPAQSQLAESTLSADESQRAARFRFETDRNRFIAAHAALRNILANYLHIPPSHITFVTGKYGKPALQNSKMGFNLSHSGHFVLIAITKEHRVGIDVERFRQDMEFEKIAKRFFSEHEDSELMSLPPEQRMVGFFNCWTRKEAYIKAHGLGLSLPLDSFDVSLAPGESAVLRATRPDPLEASRWSLLSLDVDSLHAGAVAVEGKNLEFRCWDWMAVPR